MSQYFIKIKTSRCFSKNLITSLSQPEFFIKTQKSSKYPEWPQIVAALQISLHNFTSKDVRFKFETQSDGKPLTKGFNDSCNTYLDHK